MCCPDAQQEQTCPARVAGLRVWKTSIHRDFHPMSDHNIKKTTRGDSSSFSVAVLSLISINPGL